VVVKWFYNKNKTFQIPRGMLKLSMGEIKIETYPIPLPVVESLNEGLPLPAVIGNFPFPGCRFVLDQTVEVDENYPLVMGCIENDVGEARTALVAISEEIAIIEKHNRATRALYRAIGRPCLGVTVTTTNATVLSFPF
jgi:hypothetical protein